MIQTEYRVKQSKFILILSTVAAGVFEILFLVFSIIFLLECKNKQLTSDEFAVYSMSSMIGGMIRKLLV